MHGSQSTKSAPGAIIALLAGIAVIFFVVLAVPGYAAPDVEDGEGMSEDFIVNMEIAPPVSDDPDEPDCKQTDRGMECTSTFSFDSSGKGEGTSVYTKPDPDVAGTIEMDYKMWFSGSMTTLSDSSGGPGQSPVPIASSGEGAMDGSWRMDFPSSSDHPDGSALRGVIHGDQSQALIPGTSTVRMTNKMKVDAVGESGIFEGKVATGSWTETEEFDMFGDGPGGPPSKDHGPEGEAKSASLNASEEGASMKLKLRNAKGAKAYISDLPSKLHKKDARKAAVSAAKGSSCKLVATQGKKKKSLGKAKANSKYRAQFKVKVVKKLKSGKWKLRATCKKGKKKAVAKKTLRIVS